MAAGHSERGRGRRGFGAGRVAKAKRYISARNSRAASASRGCRGKSTGEMSVDKKRYKSGTVEITVDYGYDIHTIALSGRTYDKIVAGKELSIKVSLIRLIDGTELVFEQITRWTAAAVHR